MKTGNTSALPLPVKARVNKGYWIVCIYMLLTKRKGRTGRILGILAQNRPSPVRSLQKKGGLYFP